MARGIPLVTVFRIQSLESRIQSLRLELIHNWETMKNFPDANKLAIHDRSTILAKEYEQCWQELQSLWQLAMSKPVRQPLCLEISKAFR